MMDPIVRKIVLFPIETTGDCGWCESEDLDIQLAVLPGNKTMAVCGRCEEKLRQLCTLFDITVVKGEILFGGGA